MCRLEQKKGYNWEVTYKDRLQTMKQRINNVHKLFQAEVYWVFFFTYKLFVTKLFLVDLKSNWRQHHIITCHFIE